MLSCSVISDSVIPWTAAHQAPLSTGIPGNNTRVGAMPSSRESSQPQGSNPGLPHCRWIIDWLSYHESPKTKLSHTNYINNDYTLQADSNNLHKFCRKGRNIRNRRYSPQGLTKKISWLQRQEYTTIQEIRHLIYLKFICYYTAIFKAILQLLNYSTNDGQWGSSIFLISYIFLYSSFISTDKISTI